MKIKDYMLLKDTDRYQLEKKVRELLNQGYTPFGAAFSGVDSRNGDFSGVIYHTLWLYQTMVLMEDAE